MKALKQAFFIAVLFSLLSIKAYSQKFDLVITHEGDSIACIIENIGNESIQFQMMKSYEWISVTKPLSEINEYTQNAFQDKIIVLN